MVTVPVQVASAVTLQEKSTSAAPLASAWVEPAPFRLPAVLVKTTLPAPALPAESLASTVTLILEPSSFTSFAESEMVKLLVLDTEHATAAKRPRRASRWKPGMPDLTG